MKLLFRSSLAVAVCCLTASIFFLACSKDNPVGPEPSSNVTTTVVGIVKDEARQPVAGATVTVAGKIATTDANGSFVIADVSVPAGRLVVSCKKTGYFTGSRAEVPVANGGTEVRLSMMRNTIVGTIDGSGGGSVTTDNGAVVALPSGAVSGYSGQINVAARHLSPTDSSFYNFFSGDAQGSQTTGSQTTLNSYGVMRVELTGSSGQALQLAAGKVSTLTYPIAAASRAKAPATIPLWYYDETLGMWKEDGFATKNAQGDMYVGTVKHFSDWNCDDTTGTAKVRGKVVDCNGDGVSGIVVHTGQSQTMSKSDGSFERRVPADVDFFITINPDENNGSGLPLGKFVQGIGKGQTYDVGNLMLDPSPGTITGKIVDCNGAPIAGTVNAAWGNGFAMTYTSNGSFKLRVAANKSATIEATSFKGGHASPTPITTPASCKTIDAGTLVACQGQGDYVELTPLVSTNVLDLSADGSTVATGGYNTANVEIYNTATGQKISTLVGAGGSNNYVSDIQLTNDGSRVLTEGLYDTLTLWNTANGSVVRRYEYNGSYYSQKLIPNTNAMLAIKNSFSETDSTAKIDLNTGNEIARYGFVFTQRRSRKQIYPRPNGTQFVAIETPRDSNGVFGKATVTVWDMNSNSKVSEFITSEYIGSSYLSYDGTIMVCNRPGGDLFTDNIIFYNVSNGAEIARRTIQRSFALSDLLITPDNLSILYQSNDVNAGVAYAPPAYYTIQSNAKGKEFTPPVTAKEKPFFALKFSADGKKLGGSYQDKNDNWHVVIWPVK